MNHEDMETTVHNNKTVYHTIEDRNHFLEILKENKGHIIFKFGAEWCNPCNEIKDLVYELYSDMHENVICFDVNVDESFDIYGYLRSKRIVSGIPTILVYKKENDMIGPDNNISGSNKSEIRNLLKSINEEYK